MRFSNRRIKVNTRNCNKIISELLRKKLKLSSIIRNKEFFEFNVSDNDYLACKSVLESFNVDFQTVSYHGALRGARAVKAKAMIIVGLAFGMALLIFMSSLVVKVNVTITDARYLSLVEKVLQNDGVYGLNFKKNINTDALELKLISSIDEVTDASVSIEGMTVNVNVIAKEPPYVIADGKTRIVSSDKAIITRVCVTSGTAVVKAGETVEIGQTLIDGYILTDKDEYAENPLKVPCPADGEVYGKVYYHKRVIIPDSAIITVKSGKSKTVRSLAIGSWRITPLKLSPYALYETSVHYEKMNNIVPINVTTVTYYEIVEKTVERTEYKEYMTSRAIEGIMDKIPAGAIVLSSKILDTTDDIVDIYYEVEQRIDM